MKTKVTLATLLAGLTTLSALCAGAQTKPLGLFWDNPNPVNTNEGFNIYSSTSMSIPTNQWPLLTSIPNPVLVPLTNVNGINYTNHYWFFTNVVPGNYFFTVTLTNRFWKLESFFSGVAAAQAPSTNLLINLGLTVP